MTTTNDLGILNLNFKLSDIGESAHIDHITYTYGKSFVDASQFTSDVRRGLVANFVDKNAPKKNVSTAERSIFDNDEELDEIVFSKENDEDLEDIVFPDDQSKIDEDNADYQDDKDEDNVASGEDNIAFKAEKQIDVKQANRDASLPTMQFISELRQEQYRDKIINNLVDILTQRAKEYQEFVDALLKTGNKYILYENNGQEGGNVDSNDINILTNEEYTKFCIDKSDMYKLRQLSNTAQTVHEINKKHEDDIVRLNTAQKDLDASTGGRIVNAYNTLMNKYYEYNTSETQPYFRIVSLDQFTAVYNKFFNMTKDDIDDFYQYMKRTVVDADVRRFTNIFNSIQNTPERAYKSVRGRTLAVPEQTEQNIKSEYNRGEVEQYFKELKRINDDIKKCESHVISEEKYKENVMRKIANNGNWYGMALMKVRTHIHKHLPEFNVDVNEHIKLYNYVKYLAISGLPYIDALYNDRTLTDKHEYYIRLYTDLCVAPFQVANVEHLDNIVTTIEMAVEKFIVDTNIIDMALLYMFINSCPDIHHTNLINIFFSNKTFVEDYRIVHSNLLKYIIQNIGSSVLETKLRNEIAMDNTGDFYNFMSNTFDDYDENILYWTLPYTFVKNYNYIKLQCEHDMLIHYLSEFYNRIGMSRAVEKLMMFKTSSNENIIQRLRLLMGQIKDANNQICKEVYSEYTAELKKRQDESYQYYTTSVKYITTSRDMIVNKQITQYSQPQITNYITVRKYGEDVLNGNNVVDRKNRINTVHWHAVRMSYDEEFRLLEKCKLYMEMYAYEKMIENIEQYNNTFEYFNINNPVQDIRIGQLFGAFRAYKRYCTHMTEKNQMYRAKLLEFARAEINYNIFDIFGQNIAGDILMKNQERIFFKNIHEYVDTKEMRHMSTLPTSGRNYDKLKKDCVTQVRQFVDVLKGLREYATMDDEDEPVSYSEIIFVFNKIYNSNLNDKLIKEDMDRDISKTIRDEVIEQMTSAGLTTIDENITVIVKHILMVLHKKFADVDARDMYHVDRAMACVYSVLHMLRAIQTYRPEKILTTDQIGKVVDIFGLNRNVVSTNISTGSVNMRMFILCEMKLLYVSANKDALGMFNSLVNYMETTLNNDNLNELIKRFSAAFLTIVPVKADIDEVTRLIERTYASYRNVSEVYKTYEVTEKMDVPVSKANPTGKISATSYVLRRVYDSAEIEQAKNIAEQAKKVSTNNKTTTTTTRKPVKKSAKSGKTAGKLNLGEKKTTTKPTKSFG